MRSQKSQYHWDKRSKKYVKLQADETVKAGRRIPGSKVRFCVGRMSFGRHGTQGLAAVLSEFLSRYWQRHGAFKSSLLSARHQEHQPAYQVPAPHAQSGGKGKKEEGSGLYKKWAAKNKMQVAGPKEAAGAAALAKQMGERCEGEL